MPNYKPSATENVLRLIGIHTVHKTRDPLPSDTNYGVPTLWVNESSQKAYMLILDTGSAATWIDLGDSPLPRNFDDFYDASTAAPAAVTGDSYILSEDTPLHTDWVALGATNDDYVEYTGSSWIVFTPAQGQVCYSNDLSDFYIYDGTTWKKLSLAISALTYTSDSRNPNTSDNTHVVPTLWVDTSDGTGYLLTDVTAGIATWLKLSNNQLGDAQNSVKSIAISTSAPPTEINGDRYILDSSGIPHANWDGAAQGDIVQFDGSTWVAFTPTEGTFCEVEDEDTVYIFITSWVKLFQYTGASIVTDSGSATPDSGGVLNVSGTAAQGITSSGTGNTVTLTISDATTAQKGVLETATDAEAVAVTATDKALTPSNMPALLAEPSAIGGTTRSTGAFTDLSATGAFKLYDTDDSNSVNFVWNENDTLDRTINYTINGGNRTLALHGDLTVESATQLNQDLTSDASPTFAGLTLSTTPLSTASGGTGRSSHTEYAVICGGTTGTGAQQSIASVGTANQVLTSNGAGALPSFQTPPAATDVYDNTFRILDNTDNTKEIAFEASGITTATTRTITMPDRDMNLDTPTFTTVTTTGAIVNNVLTNTQSRYKIGLCENASLSLSGGVLTLKGGDGNNLSSSNTLFACIASGVTAGKPILHTITSNLSIDESDMTGAYFNGSSGVAWADDAPYYLYLAADSSDTNPKLFVGVIPHLEVLPSATYIGDPSAPSNCTTQYSVFCGDNITEANYAGMPCICIGAVRATRDASNNNTFTTLSAGVDGIGLFHNSTVFSYPFGQNGANSGTWCIPNSSTVPSFTQFNYDYTIAKTGIMRFNISMRMDGGTDGSGGGIAWIACPFRESGDLIGLIGEHIGLINVRAQALGNVDKHCFAVNTGNGIYLYLDNTGGTPIYWSNFTNGYRHILGSCICRIRSEV